MRRTKRYTKKFSKKNSRKNKRRGKRGGDCKSSNCKISETCLSGIFGKACKKRDQLLLHPDKNNDCKLAAEDAFKQYKKD